MRPVTVRPVTGAAPSAQQLTWSSDDGRRLETVRVVITERGLRANGYIVVAGRSSFGASYSVLCDAIGRTRRLTVRSDSITSERGLSMTRTPGGPWLDGAGKAPPQPELNLAVDVDLAASAFTNSLAIRRLGLHYRRGDEEITVAEVDIPRLGVAAVKQRYRTVDVTSAGARIDYDGAAGPHRLTVDRLGFVVDVPHLSYRLVSSSSTPASPPPAPAPARINFSSRG
jgi:uncharacterized protein